MEGLVLPVGADMCDMASNADCVCLSNSMNGQRLCVFNLDI